MGTAGGAEHLERLEADLPKGQPRHAAGRVLPRDRIERIVERLADALLDHRPCKRPASL